MLAPMCGRFTLAVKVHALPASFGVPTPIPPPPDPESVTAPNGALVINAAGDITTTDAGAIDVDLFELNSGDWVQNPGAQGFLSALPSFNATDFQVGPGASFLRVAGGEVLPDEGSVRGS